MTFNRLTTCKMCSSILNVNMFIAIRSVGIFGMVTSLITTLRLYLDLTSADSQGTLYQILHFGLEDLWDSPERRLVHENKTDSVILINYLMFVFFCVVANMLLLMATFLKRRWCLILWMLCETLRLMWQLNFYLKDVQPAEYAPGILDLSGILLNIISGIYLCHKVTQMQDV